jgi:hypothetical protein
VAGPRVVHCAENERVAHTGLHGMLRKWDAGTFAIGSQVSIKPCLAVADLLILGRQVGAISHEVAPMLSWIELVRALVTLEPAAAIRLLRQALTR